MIGATETVNCSKCQYWRPKYRDIGRCEREGASNAPMWVEEGKPLLTHKTFSCSEHTPVKPVEKETL